MTIYQQMNLPNQANVEIFVYKKKALVLIKTENGHKRLLRNFNASD